MVNGVNFRDWGERAHGFEDMAAVSVLPANLTGFGDPVALDGRAVSPQYFSILGVSPALGRPFTAEEARPGRGNVIILSFGLWQSRLGGDSGVLGRQITLNGSPATILGVLPRGFALESPNNKVASSRQIAIINEVMCPWSTNSRNYQNVQ